MKKIKIMSLLFFAILGLQNTASASFSDDGIYTEKFNEDIFAKEKKDIKWGMSKPAEVSKLIDFNGKLTLNYSVRDWVYAYFDVDPRQSTGEIHGSLQVEGSAPFQIMIHTLTEDGKSEGPVAYTNTQEKAIFKFEASKNIQKIDFNFVAKPDKAYRIYIHPQKKGQTGQTIVHEVKLENSFVIISKKIKKISSSDGLQQIIDAVKKQADKLNVDLGLEKDQVNSNDESAVIPPPPPPMDGLNKKNESGIIPPPPPPMDGLKIGQNKQNQGLNLGGIGKQKENLNQVKVDPINPYKGMSTNDLTQKGLLNDVGALKELARRAADSSDANGQHLAKLALESIAKSNKNVDVSKLVGNAQEERKYIRMNEAELKEAAEKNPDKVIAEIQRRLVINKDFKLELLLKSIQGQKLNKVDKNEIKAVEYKDLSVAELEKRAKDSKNPDEKAKEEIEKRAKNGNIQAKIALKFWNQNVEEDDDDSNSDWD
jgi:hypothetical protein